MANRPSNWGNGRGGRPWRRTVERIKVRDRYTCQKCGKVTLDGEVDHISNARDKDGRLDDSDLNLQYLCKSPCHSDKTLREAGIRVATPCDEEGWPV